MNVINISIGRILEHGGHGIAGQLRPKRPDTGAEVGADEHRGVRRRPEERHDIWRKRRGRLGVVLGAVPADEGPISARHLQQRQHFVPVGAH